MSTSSASGQTTCEPPRICATPQLLEDAAQKKADNICKRDSEKKVEYRAAAASERKRADQCDGRLYELQNAPQAPASWECPLWLCVPLDVAVPAVGVAAGVCAGMGDCPNEITVGLGVAAVLGVVARVVLELLD